MPASIVAIEQSPADLELCPHGIYVTSSTEIKSYRQKNVAFRQLFLMLPVIEFCYKDEVPTVARRHGNQTVLRRILTLSGAMTDSGNPTFNYLPVPEVVNRLGLYVTGAGADVVPAGATYPQQNHPELYDFSWHAGRVLPEFQFLFISAGRGEFESRETGPQKVGPGTIVILFPDVWHRYRPDPVTGWTEYWISLGGDLLFQWHQRGLFSAEQPLTTIRQPEKTIERYQSVIDFVMKRPEQDAPMLTAHAMALIATALERAQTSVESINAGDEPVRSDDPLVVESLRVIWNNSHQRVSVDMIAKQVGVTRRTLERHFKKHLGRTLLQELVACRLQRAKRLLRETNVPIKYVAHAAGFSSLPNLCKVFRREIGTTPGKYRETTAVEERSRRLPGASGNKSSKPESAADPPGPRKPQNNN